MLAATGVFLVIAAVCLLVHVKTMHPKPDHELVPWPTGSIIDGGVLQFVREANRVVPNAAVAAEKVTSIQLG